MRIQLWLESLKGKDDLKDLVVDGRIILQRYSRETGLGSVDCINMAQDRGRILLKARKS